MLVDIEKIAKWLEDAVAHYEKSAPVVSQYCDKLYIQLQDEAEKVSIRELQLLNQLLENYTWMQPNHAANLIYKICNQVDKDTTGMLGF